MYTEHIYMHIFPVLIHRHSIRTDAFIDIHRHTVYARKKSMHITLQYNKIKAALLFSLQDFGWCSKDHAGIHHPKTFSSNISYVGVATFKPSESCRGHVQHANNNCRKSCSPRYHMPRPGYWQTLILLPPVCVP